MNKRHGHGKHSATNIFRRCGQLRIPYEEVIASPYCKRRGIEQPHYLTPYKEGIKGTIDWGINQREAETGKDVLEFNKNEMRNYLINE